MFILIYTIFFFIFIILGFLMGKKYEEYFFYNSRSNNKEDNTSQEVIKYQLPNHLFDDLDLSKQYDTIIKAYDNISGIGIQSQEKIDIIICKKNLELTEWEKDLENLINKNKVYFKIFLLE